MRNSTKKIVYRGMLIALAFIFSYAETLIPINIGIPGAKLGLANLVVITALYTLGYVDAAVLSIVRMILVAATFGNMAALLYSLGGGILSLFVMVIAKKTGLFSIRGVSVLGGVSHNIGQIIVAMAVLETSTLIYYLPVLLIAGTVSGVLIGILGAMMTERVEKFVKRTVQ